jgi:hypothetical protein
MTMKIVLACISLFLTASNCFSQQTHIQPLRKLEKIEHVGELLLLYNNLMYGYGDARMKTPSFVLQYEKEKSQETFKKWSSFLFNYMGYLKLLPHETFDSINAELHLGLSSRNDLADLSKYLNPSDVDRLKKRLNFNFVTRKSIGKEDEGKYFFVFNESFWNKPQNARFFIEFVQDHEILDLTEFRFYDTYEQCLARALLIIHNTTQVNPKNCENFSDMVINQLNKLTNIDEGTVAKSKKIFDEYCTTPMFEASIYLKDYDGSPNALQQFVQKQQSAIAFYESLFAKFNEKPFFIIRIKNT